MEKSPIIVVDDDNDDLELIKEAVQTLKLDRTVRYFQTATELEDYLRRTDLSPFLIICDLNLPQTDGFELRMRIAEDKDLKYKSVPFIFWSTSASEKQIQHAYDLPSQGFFFKPGNFSELCKTLTIMVDYWECSQHPKKVE